MPQPNFKPALTIAQLKEIQDRNRGNKDVIALLWEVRRLQALAIRANQLCKVMGTASMTGEGRILEALREELEGEPILEERKAREDGLNLENKK